MTHRVEHVPVEHDAAEEEEDGLEAPARGELDEAQRHVRRRLRVLGHNRDRQVLVVARYVQQRAVVIQDRHAQARARLLGVA